jgi:lipopolysaccharide heptosyltransferase I
MNSSPRILIIRLSALGDILHALPAFNDIRSAFPNATIDWLVARKCVSLVASVPGINTIHILDTSFSDSGWKRFGRMIRTLRSQEYDFTIDFQGLIKTALLGSISGSKLRFGFSKELVRERPAHWFYSRTLSKPETQSHVIEINRALATQAGACRHDKPVSLSVSSEDRAKVEELLHRCNIEEFIVLNPGGGWPTKRWRQERFGALAQMIQRKTGLPVVVTTGPGEESLYSAIADSCGAVRPFHFPLPFLQLVPLFEKAKLFIGGDTGPFHLACALKVPVLGIFGPTSPVRNGAWNEGDEILSHQLPCSYCYGRTCPTKNECMDIPADEVFAAVARRLEKLEQL